MKLYQLHRRQRIPIPLEEAWSFFSNPHNLPHITPPDMGFEITSETPEETYAGMLITYTVRPLLGIPVTWVTEITHVQEPYFFVDEQRFGPYRFWHHQHRFTPTDGGVLADDLVSYGLPFGVLGQAANALVVRKRLEGIFDFRRRIMIERFGP